MKQLKRKFSLAVVLVFLFTMVLGTPAYAASWTSVKKVDAYSGVQIFYNGQQLTGSSQPLIINNTTYVPLRLIMETLGNAVFWDPTNYRVTINSTTSMELAAKDAEIAALKKQITQLENKIAELEGGNLEDIEAALSDYFEDAGEDYFNDEDIEVIFSLDGDEDEIEYEIELDFDDAYYYDDLSELDEDDIEDFLDDVEDKLTDEIDGTKFEDADITGILVDYDDSDLYVEYDGRYYSYSWNAEDLSDIEDAVIDYFADAGDDYFNDDDLRFTISLSGDEDDIEYTIYVDFYYSDYNDDLTDLDKDDIEDFLDDVEDAIYDEADGTDYEWADITGELIDDDDSDYYVKYNGRNYYFSW